MIREKRKREKEKGEKRKYEEEEGKKRKRGITQKVFLCFILYIIILNSKNHGYEKMI